MTQIAALSQFDIIKIEGDDASSFLQGQVTCDVTKLDQEPWLAGCHCNAKGKMWSTFLAKKMDGAIYLIATKASAQATIAELKKYAVFAKAEISDDTSNWFLYGASQTQEGAINIELSAQHILILSKSKLTSSNESNLWWYEEVISGRAHIPAELIGEYVPQMLNVQALDYLSFNKGCYMGQETVARMRYLGKNKRALYVAEADEVLSLTLGQDVYVNLNGNRRSQGKVINFAQHDGKTAVQLVLPKDLEPQPIYINSEDDTALTLIDLPYSLID